MIVIFFTDRSVRFRVDQDHVPVVFYYGVGGVFYTVILLKSIEHKQVMERGPDLGMWQLYTINTSVFFRVPTKVEIIPFPCLPCVRLKLAIIKRVIIKHHTDINN